MMADCAPSGRIRLDALARYYTTVLHGLSIATSGDYRRWFAHDDRRYAHTLDPRTGRPLVNDVASVTVLHPQCMMADAWATARDRRARPGVPQC